MSLTLLLDLDDTLLDNDIQIFLPAYLKVFAQEAAPFIEPDKFVNSLLAGTRAMVNNRQPDCTLQEVFESVFFPAIGLGRKLFQPLQNKFYSQVFPMLKSLTSPRSEAVKFIHNAEERGYRIAIATNPLFPKTANLQRLDWANLPIEKHSFEVVTSLEEFHFAKPEPAYYAELLARMGWPSGPVIMVGDDMERDVGGSRRLGLPAFWITRNNEAAPINGNAPAASGWVNDILPWLDAVPPESLQPDYSSPTAMLAILRSTPAALDSFLRQIPPVQWTERPQPGEWCLTEILCHLRDVDMEVHLPRLHQVIAEDNPFLPGKDTDPWAEERQYAREDGRRAFGQYIVARKKLLELLESLSTEDWQRTARHSILGPTRLAELVSIIASHDKLHIQQIRQALAEVTLF